MDLAKASINDFQPLIDDKFGIEVDIENATTLTLTEVESRAGMGASGRDPFALVFRAEGETVLEQRIYRLEHESLGAIEIFLVPISQGDDHVLYEAVFS